MTENPTLEMDMDVECSRCLEKGATETGLCLKCIAEKGNLKGKHFGGRAIGFYTLTKAKAELCAKIDEAAKKIDEAYIKAGGTLTIALGLGLAGTKMAGEIKVITSINFVESRFKRTSEAVVNEKQMDLPGVKK